MYPFLHSILFFIMILSASLYFLSCLLGLINFPLFLYFPLLLRNYIFRFCSWNGHPSNFNMPTWLNKTKVQSISLPISSRIRWPWNTSFWPIILLPLQDYKPVFWFLPSVVKPRICGRHVSRCTKKVDLKDWSQYAQRNWDDRQETFWNNLHSWWQLSLNLNFILAFPMAYKADREEHFLLQS